MNKRERQQKILSLIRANPIGTQEDLRALLERTGVPATQSSVSRDLEELGVVKHHGHYTLPRTDGAAIRGLLSLDHAGDSLVIARTVPGLASAVAVEIDAAAIPEIVGTIAGEDTIFVAVRDAKSQRVAAKEIWALLRLNNHRTHMNTDIKKIVLAYSGGLDTSVMLRWLKEQYQCEVVCYCADVGQGDELSGLEEKALATGASKLYVEDLREEFVRDYVWTAVKANAVYEGVYLMGTSLARPVIAKRQIEIAQEEGADAVAHGATGKGNDQVRFELTYYALQPDIKVIAPWREWSFKGRTDLIAYAKDHNIPVTATAAQPYSTDANLMHISYEGGILEDPWAEPPKYFQLTRSPEDALVEAQTIEISFDKGEPVAIEGKQLDPVALLETLNLLGGQHGIGRVDLVENRFVGMKSRGVYETPGVTILHAAHRALESITLDREVMHLRDSLGVKFAECIYYGFWFAPEFKLMRKMIDETQATVSGDVRLKLFRGNAIVVGRRSPHSLYDENVATFEADTVYNQRDAEGFIKLNALRLRLGGGR